MHETIIASVASGADRHLDITFGLQVVESSSLVSVLFREALSLPYISVFHLLVNRFSVTSFRTFFDDPFPSLHWWAVPVSGRIVSSGISDVAIASVHSEKTNLKKLIMIFIISMALKKNKNK